MVRGWREGALVSGVTTGMGGRFGKRSGTLCKIWREVWCEVWLDTFLGQLSAERDGWKEAPVVSFAGSNLHVLYWSNLPKGSHFIHQNIRDKVPEDESLD